MMQRATTSIEMKENLIPVCAWCNKVRDRAGRWYRDYTGLSACFDDRLTHGICPECLDEMNGEINIITIRATDNYVQAQI